MCQHQFVLPLKVDCDFFEAFRFFADQKFSNQSQKANFSPNFRNVESLNFSDLEKNFADCLQKNMLMS